MSTCLRRGVELDFTHLLALVERPDVQGKIGGAAITGIGAILAQFLRRREAITWGQLHAFIHFIPSPQSQQGANTSVNQNVTAASSLGTQIYSRTIVVRNNGNLTGEEVEIHLTNQPFHFQLWPQFTYTTDCTPENGFIIRMPNMGPREYVMLEMISINVEAPIVMRVRTRTGEAKLASITPMFLAPAWLRYSVLGFAVFGLISVLGWIIQVIPNG